VLAGAVLVVEEEEEGVVVVLEPAAGEPVGAFEGAAEGALLELVLPPHDTSTPTASVVRRVAASLRRPARFTIPPELGVEVAPAGPSQAQVNVTKAWTRRDPPYRVRQRRPARPV
jgi:hypothetical protein